MDVDEKKLLNSINDNLKNQIKYQQAQNLLFARMESNIKNNSQAIKALSSTVTSVMGYISSYNTNNHHDTKLAQLKKLNETVLEKNVNLQDIHDIQEAVLRKISCISEMLASQNNDDSQNYNSDESSDIESLLSQIDDDIQNINVSSGNTGNEVNYSNQLDTIKKILNELGTSSNADTKDICDDLEAISSELSSVDSDLDGMDSDLNDMDNDLFNK